MGKKKQIKYFENIWGKKIERYRDFNLIAFFHNYKKKNIDDLFVDEQTWNDLNFNSLFAKLDRNISKIGQQFLFHILHKYESNSEVLEQRYKIADFFRTNKKLREEIQIPLLNLDEMGAYFIPTVLYGDFPVLPKYPFIFHFLSYLSITLFAVSFFEHIYFIPTIVLWIVNLFINKIYTDHIYENFIGLSNLNKMIIASRKIVKINYDAKIEQLDRLKQNSELLKKLNSKLGKFVIDKSGLDELSAAIIEYGNMFFLFDLRAYLRSVTILKDHLEEIREVYETVAEIDSLISLASYLEEVKTVSTPIFITEKSIFCKDIYHPTLVNPVTNNVGLTKSALITGSNMAGKTTFIKTIGVNIILAQTIFIVHAAEMKTYRFVVKSSIKREDNIEDSKSYFFAEIEAIQNFVNLSDNGGVYLFLIDEIFRGTNTIERLAASTAVLEKLNKSNKTLVTTHDIELQYLLENKYDYFHFSEQVENGKYYFDYKIEKGNFTKGNAVKLLEIKGYPKEIIRKANKTVELLLKLNSSNNGIYKIN